MNKIEIKKWKNTYLFQLKEYFLPFWDEKYVDKENKGYFTCLDRYGNIYSTDKSVWFQGRTGYIFSLLYNTYEKNEKYLEISRSAL